MGKRGPKVKDISGIQFNRLTPLRIVGKGKDGYIWLCQCICGNLKETSLHALKNGTQSCGCLRRDNLIAMIRATPREVHRARATTHGMAGGRKEGGGYIPASPEHRAYCGARSRCNNPDDKSYTDYGGRGIEFRFESFEQFLAELGPRPVAFDAKGKSLYSLDRKNNDGNYEPGNVHWANRSQQNSNQRRQKRLPVPY